jgi:hypothetical protein
MEEINIKDQSIKAQVFTARVPPIVRGTSLNSSTS